MKRKNMIWGLVLIIIGALLLLNSMFNIYLLSASNFWPLIVLAIGVIFEYKFFSTGKNPGLLVPGGILSTIGVLFLFETATNWQFAGNTWPVYELAVAVGLFQLYLFGGKKKGLLIPVCILTFLGLFSLAALVYGNLLNMINYSVVIPALIILIGIYIIIRNSWKKEE